jgi:hypothetical protein
MFEREGAMKPLIFVLVICLVTAVTVRAQETSAGGATIQSAADIPEGYEIGEKSLSPNGRFAILYPIRGNDSAELPPNLLVCLKPYSVLTRIGTEGGRWQGARDQPLAKWNGNSIVAIWIAARWGMKDLAIYEIEADEIKRIQPVWRRVWLLFDQDFRERFLSKYPDEKGSGVIFVSKSEGPASKAEFEFKGDKMLLNLFADNKPDLSVTPHWTASLHAVWNLDTAELEKVDFQPGPIEERPRY